jgi:hypothetical protein
MTSSFWLGETRRHEPWFIPLDDDRRGPAPRDAA